MKLKIRVSRSYAELQSFIDKLAEVCDVLVVYEHEADEDISRTHIHCYADNPQVSTDTMKNWVKKAMGTTVFPKTDWSFAEAQDIGFITYMSYGRLNPLFVKGIETSAIADLKDKWVDNPKKTGKTQYVLKIENPAQQKLRQWEMVEEINRRFQMIDPEASGDPVEKLIRIIRQVVIIENKTVCGRYKFRDYYDTIMSLNQENTNSMKNFLSYRS